MACTVMWHSPAEPASAPRGLKYQPYTLMQSKQQIHTMHRIACPAFQQIIDRHSDYTCITALFVFITSATPTCPGDTNANE